MNDIDILEEFIEAYRMAEEVLDGEVIDAIESLIAENKELKEERDIYRSQLNSAFSNGFIHKSKVEEKIEEIEKKFKEETNPNILVTLKILKDEMQSLLGKE